MPDWVGVFFAFTLASMIQTISGFGMGLIGMPILIPAIGIDPARVTMVVIATITQVVNVIRGKESLALRSIGWLGLSGLLGILGGFWIVDYGIFPEQRLIQSLAILTIAYALSALFIPKLPHLTHDRFAPVAGFVSGILTGAYNVGGPPVIMYANARRWTAEQTRANLNAFFTIKNVFVLVSHFIVGNFTASILRWIVVGLPAMGVGIGIGLLIAHRIPEKHFQRIVLVLLLVVGLQMLFSA
ncbi:MAG: sulfite exporter TauE/SafE family protein [Phototrophicaceae bacterium]